MTDANAVKMPPAIRSLSDRAAIVGVGETDYHREYQAARSKNPNRELPTPESLATAAFERALADSGLDRKDIDGLAVSYLYGGPTPAETATLFGITPRHLSSNIGIMAGPLPMACAAIAAGECDTIVLVYAAASRAIGRQYGGNTYGLEAPNSYYYYLPWGWSSQAAHWAFVWSHYQALYGASKADLGSVAVSVRQNAVRNPNAIMRTPLTIEDYLASRYIVAPMHLLDLCLVNDGAVCLIVRRADMARDLPHSPVLVSGWGEAKVGGGKLHHLVRDRLREQCQQSGRQAFDMAGAVLSDIGHFEGYDASTIHLVNQIEGFDLAEVGQGVHYFQNGCVAPHGSVHVNTSGGMLSEAYMHGWNQVAEITRQLRHEAGDRQIVGLQRSMFSMAQTDQVHPLILTRGA